MDGTKLTRHNVLRILLVLLLSLSIAASPTMMVFSQGTGFVYGEEESASSGAGIETTDEESVAPFSESDGITVRMLGEHGAVVGLTQKSGPAKSTYLVGEVFDLTGFVLTATYEDGFTEDITPDSEGVTITSPEWGYVLGSPLTIDDSSIEADVAYKDFVVDMAIEWGIPDDEWLDDYGERYVSSKAFYFTALVKAPVGEITDIATASDFNNFAAQVNAGLTTKSARLVADISVSGTGGLIGTDANAYAGTFDGNGHTITVNINANNKKGVAVFANVKAATIKNLTVAGTITATGKSTVWPYVSTGGIVAEAGAGTTIENCVNNANITGTVNIAGIVGLSSMASIEVTNSVNNGNITSTSDGNAMGGIPAGVGGIAGNANGGTFSRVINTGTISGKCHYMGGIIGYSSNGPNPIINSYNTGVVSNEATYNQYGNNKNASVGGIIGYAANLGYGIENAFNYGTVSTTQTAGTPTVGAIIGYTSNDDPNASYYQAHPSNDYYLANGTIKSVGNLANDLDAFTAKTAEEFLSLASSLGEAFTDGTLHPILTEQAQITGVTVTTSPTKVDYEAGETFSAAGLVLTATYSDERTQIIPAGAYDWDIKSALTVYDDKITVAGTFEGYGFSVEIAINVTVHVTNPTVALDTAAVWSGESARINILLSDNPGIAKGTFKLTYDTDALEFAGTGHGYYAAKLEEDGSVTFYAGANHAFNGIATYVSFNVLDAAASGDYTVGISDLVVTRLDGTEVPVTAVNGTVTVKSPYQIGNAGDILAFANTVNSGELGARAELTADINLTGLNWEKIGNLHPQWDEYNDQGQVIAVHGAYPQFYIGTFDGKGHTITLDIHHKTDDWSTENKNREDELYWGLFGYVGQGALIKDLVLDGIVEAHGTVGALVGVFSGGVIDNVTNNATVIGHANTGGIAGSVGTLATIQNSANNGIVIGDQYKVKIGYTNVTRWEGGYYIGGIAGSSAGKLLNNTNNGEVSGFGSVGGIVGLTNLGQYRATVEDEFVRYDETRGNVNYGNVTRTESDDLEYDHNSEGVGAVVGLAHVLDTVLGNFYLLGSAELSVGQVSDGTVVTDAHVRLLDTPGESAAASLAGPASVFTAENAEYTVSVTDAADVVAAEIVIEVDATYFFGIDDLTIGLNGLLIVPDGGANVRWVQVSGTDSLWQGHITLGTAGGDPVSFTGSTDILKIVFGTNLNKFGTTPVTLVSVALEAQSGGGTETLPITLGTDTVETTITDDDGGGEQVGAPGSGDLDGDGYATVFDAMLLVRYITGLETLTSAQIAAVDMDGDGYLTIMDAVLLLRKSVGL
ncbi:MAG: bacterial Ig-like domain-containing protein [Clostridiales Family XIII bacterium]|jgi:hypothetical protein|nr:bacterial Ig-like domain-containing protein [Clostridiales Family XIII bacterium]